MKPNFEPGGKWEKWFPLFDSLDTFLFTPGHATKSGSHIRDGIDLKRTMFMVIIALVPCLLFGIFNTGHQYYIAQGLFTEHWSDGFGDKVIFGLWKVLPMVIVSYGVGLGVEFIFCIAKKHAIQEGFLVSGMLIPLVMPMDVPLWTVAVATIFAVVIGKEVFGGTGMNVVNVALTARAFLFFAYPTQMSGDKVWVHNEIENGKAYITAYDYQDGNTDPYTFTGNVLNVEGNIVGSVVDGELTSGVDAYTGATNLGSAALTIKMEKDIREINKLLEKNKGLAADHPKKLNESQVQGKIAEREQIEKNKGVAISKVASTEDSFFGFEMGSIGETSVLMCLIGALILIATGIGSWQIMLSFVLGGLAMGYIFNAFEVNAFMGLDPMRQIMLGGFMFGAVFMATDPVTASQTPRGKWIYGFLAGFFAIMIRVFNPAYPEGVMMAILFMNVMAPLIDHFVIQSNVKRRLKRLKLKTA